MEQFLKDQIKVTLSGKNHLSYIINLYDNEITFTKTENYVTKMHIPIIKEPPTLVDVV